MYLRVACGRHLLPLCDPQPCVRIAERFREVVGPDVPLLFFPKGSRTALRLLGGPRKQEFLRLFSVVSLDYTTDPQDARAALGSPADGSAAGYALQGNLDPCALYCAPEEIEERVEEMLREFGVSKGCSAGLVANLGHGMLPDHDPEHAKAFVDAVHRVSRRLIAGEEEGRGTEEGVEAEGDEEKEQAAK